MGSIGNAQEVNKAITQGEWSLCGGGRAWESTVPIGLVWAIAKKDSELPSPCPHHPSTDAAPGAPAHCLSSSLNRGMCLPHPHLPLLPVLGLSPDAPRYMWDGVHQHVLPLLPVPPHLRWKPLSQWLQLQLWHGLQPVWILSWDWWVSGAGNGDFRDLLPLGRRILPTEPSGRPSQDACSHAGGRLCAFLERWGPFILHLPGKSKVFFQISQPHGSLKNKMLITCDEQVLSTSYMRWARDVSLQHRACWTHCASVLAGLPHEFDFIHRFRTN